MLKKFDVIVMGTGSAPSMVACVPAKLGGKLPWWIQDHLVGLVTCGDANPRKCSSEQRRSGSRSSMETRRSAADFVP
jgi:hypothetical protein